MHGLFVARQDEVDAIAVHAEDDAAVDEILYRAAHDEAARQDDDITDEEHAPLRHVDVFAHHHGDDIGAARAAPLGESQADARASQAATEDGRPQDFCLS